MEETKITPSQIVEALLKQAGPGPATQAIDAIQKQLDAIFGHIQGQTARLVNSLSSTRLELLHTKLLAGIIAQVLIDKNVITKEEFDQIYEEKVIKTMDEYVSNIKAAMEEKHCSEEECKTCEEKECEKPEAEGEVVQFPVAAKREDE